MRARLSSTRELASERASSARSRRVATISLTVASARSAAPTAASSGALRSSMSSWFSAMTDVLSGILQCDVQRADDRVGVGSRLFVYRALCRFVLLNERRVDVEQHLPLPLGDRPIVDDGVAHLA